MAFLGRAEPIVPKNLSIILFRISTSFSLLFSHYSCCNTIYKLSSSRQTLQNCLDFPAPDTSRHSSGNSITRCEAVMFFGSLDPSPRALRLPLGGRLQWTLLFHVRSDKAGAFRGSNTDLVELTWIGWPMAFLGKLATYELASKICMSYVAGQWHSWGK